MKCDEVLKVVGEYLDSELDPRTNLLVSRHIDACSGCYQRFDQERRVESAFSGILRQPPDPKFWNKIERKIRGGDVHPVRWLLAAGIIAAIVGSVFWMLRPSSPSMSLPQESLRCHERVLAGQLEPDFKSAFAVGLSSRLGFPIHLSGVGQIHAKINAARVCELGKQSIGLLWGELESKPVTFMILHERVVNMFPQEGRSMQAVVHGYSFQAIKSGELYYCGIGQVTPRALEEALNKLAFEK